MSKDRVSASVEPEVAEFLQRDSVNASGLINKLVKQHMNGGASEDMIREFRIKQLQSELDEMEGRVDRKREELEKLQEIDDEKSETKRVKLDEARETIAEKGIPLDPSNPAIKNWAGKIGMTPEAFVDELEETHD